MGADAAAETDLAGRLFVAVPLSEATRAGLQRAVSRLAPTSSLPGRVVRAENWHMTLAFLGDTTHDTATQLLAELAAAPLGPRFAYTLDHLGAFPRPERARVLWLGVGAGKAELDQLAGTVRAALRRADCPTDDKPFRGHITLSRLDPARDVSELVGARRIDAVTAAADRIVVYRSQLGHGPARYEALGTFPLQ